MQLLVAQYISFLQAMTLPVQAVMEFHRRLMLGLLGRMFS
jgi:hypothetical protein